MAGMSKESERGASHLGKSLTVWEKIVAIALLVAYLPSIAFRMLFEIAQQRAFDGRRIKLILLRNAAKVVVHTNSVEVSQALASTTGTVVARFCKTRGLAHEMTTLHPKGFAEARLHTIPTADTSAKKAVLLYSHGGGYIRPASGGMVNFAHLLAKTLGCSQLSFLEYTLAPQGKYPTQLAQAAAALHHLLASYSPAQLFLAGDSAGGNLSLALLAHLNRAHPAIVPIPGDVVLAGTICISPRCANATTSASFAANGSKDVLDAQIAQFFIKEWEPKPEVWAEACRGGEDFWASEGSLRTEKILLVAGEIECYVDDIRDFARMIDAPASREAGRGADRQLVVVKGAMHDQTVLEFGLGIEDGSMTMAILEWASNHRLAT